MKNEPPIHYTFHVNGSEINQHGITFHPVFLTITMTDKEALQLIEMLAYKLKFSYPINLVYTGSLISEPPDPARCSICGWPLADTMENGCVPGNCSMRPKP